ncbi:MAG: LytTR family DNA-binding domain-containing protein [Rikenellaceae bacterium]|nr:LytTR family DNA-binding domain-containing protein [Rikenellaceae bacterium]
MNCIIVDDEPLAREAMERLISRHGKLVLKGKFNNARSAGSYIAENPVELIFLDIRMPGVTGIEFARTIPRTTLVVFCTAYGEYALESYEVDAVDYLVKPVSYEKFEKAANKAIAYHELLTGDEKQSFSEGREDFILVKSDKRFYKISHADILFVEGLKDYIIIQLDDKRIITKMTLKHMEGLLPANYMRVNKSYIVNTDRIESFDTHDIFIGKYEIAIGLGYREEFIGKFFG